MGWWAGEGGLVRTMPVHAPTLAPYYQGESPNRVNPSELCHLNKQSASLDNNSLQEGFQVTASGIPHTYDTSLIVRVVLEISSDRCC